MRTRLTVLGLAISLGAALTACGGGVEKSDFTAKADASCATGNAAISAVAKPSNAPQVATAAGTATTTVDGQVAALRAMKTPGGDGKKQVDGIIAAIGAVGGATRALQDAAGRNDEPAMARAAGEMQSKVDDAAAQAQVYGLTQCGTGLKPAVANLFDGTKGILKSSYVTKAEAACREAGRKVGALPEPGESLASLGRFIDRYLPIGNKVLTDVKALPAPPGDESTTADISAALEAGMGKIEELGAAAKANDTRLVVALSEELNLSFTAVNAKFDAYGLESCGSLSEF